MRFFNMKIKFSIYDNIKNTFITKIAKKYSRALASM